MVYYWLNFIWNKSIVEDATALIERRIKFNNKVDDKYYYFNKKYKSEMCDLLAQEISDDNTVYQ